MAEKILFTARVNRHLEAFHVPYMQLLKDMGYEIHTAAGGSMTASCVDRHFDIDFARLPFELRNIRAYRELKRVVDGEGYKLIHCHTPTSSVITRLAARKARKRGTTVLYTAHGFRFFGAASLADKVIFRNIERFSARFTDHIWTINR
ncbi:MAG: glycosyltransferase, partial [Oscillospiraceae bacterium]|nr:glycosyltransferase [Oscillospiraceae bacterium]